VDLTDLGAVSYDGPAVPRWVAGGVEGPFHYGRENVGMRSGRDVRGWLLGLAAWVGIGGCGTRGPAPTAPSQPFRGLAITVAAVGDPAILATVDAQRGEWTASRGAAVSIRPSPVDPRALEGIDVLVFPGERLGDLVDAGALAVLTEALVQPPALKEDDGPAEEPAGPKPDDAGAVAGPDSNALRFNEIAPAFRDQVAKYGSDRMAFPYGGTALVLVYDRGAFERPENREAAEKGAIALEPPQTWEQLDALARFFQGRDWDGDGSPDFGLALPMGPDAEGLGEAVFLARAASLGQHRDQYSFLFNAETMAPRIDSPPFVEALEALLKAKACGPPEMSGFDAEAARRAFREGKVALLIDRAEMAARWGHGKASVGVAPLPGSGRVYDPARKQWDTPRAPNDTSYLPTGGGWLVGINRAGAGQRRDAAIDFARYLIGPATAQRVCADRAFPMLPVRPSLLSQGPPDPRAALGVDARQWSDAVNRTLIARRVVPGLRIPQSDGYLADLSRGRAAAVGGEPAADTLKGVAEAWAARTKALGEARQTWHYRRSLNALATLPEPPAR
jgi:multiple sugar transport system substrate-binding protein